MMTPAEISNRLRSEFPRERVSFTMWVYAPDDIFEVVINTKDLGNILCTDLEDGIRKIKTLRGLKVAI